jgi:diguanylate cyclase (GGDEF)-like protein
MHSSSDNTGWGALVEAALLGVLEAADEGIVLFDAAGMCRMMGRRVGEMFGVDPGGLVGKSRAEVLGALSSACEEPQAFLESLGKDDLREPPRVLPDIDLRTPRPRKVVWTSFPIARDQSPFGRLAIVRDVTRDRSAERSQRQLLARIDEVSPRDALTGLPNARRFREDLEREHGRSTRAWDSYAVLRVDIDGMGEINDQLGLPVGDQVLEAIAACLNTCRREYDVLARFDGDEFVALLPGADAVAASTVAQRMLKAVHQHPFELADKRKISVCIGGTVWVPPSGESAQDILRRAGIATIQARALGRGRVTIDGGREGQ